MLEAVQFEIKLVDFSSDDTIRRDPDRSNNPFQLWQLRKMFPLVSTVLLERPGLEFGTKAFGQC